jgi:hypothetical protein
MNLIMSRKNVDNRQNPMFDQWLVLLMGVGLLRGAGVGQAVDELACRYPQGLIHSRTGPIVLG